MSLAGCTTEYHDNSKHARHHSDVNDKETPAVDKNIRVYTLLRQ